MIASISNEGKQLAMRNLEGVVGGRGSRKESLTGISAERGRIPASARRPRFTLNELLVDVTPEIREAFDWGHDKGREIIDE